MGEGQGGLSHVVDGRFEGGMHLKRSARNVCGAIWRGRLRSRILKRNKGCGHAIGMQRVAGVRRWRAKGVAVNSPVASMILCMVDNVAPRGEVVSADLE